MTTNRTILIARHAETTSNLSRRYAGWSDEPLTHRGREQSLDLARRVADRGLTRVRSSCIARAKETATLVGNTLGVPVVWDERLNELRMGPWEGLTEDEVAERYPREYGLWLSRPDQVRLDGRETLHQVASRLLVVLADSAASGQRELLLTHVALVRVAWLLSQGRSLEEYKQLPVENCQCVEVPPPDEWRQLRAVVVEPLDSADRLERVAAG